MSSRPRVDSRYFTHITHNNIIVIKIRGTGEPKNRYHLYYLYFIYLTLVYNICKRIYYTKSRLKRDFVLSAHTAKAPSEEHFAIY